jgi:hypothetical protein
MFDKLSAAGVIAAALIAPPGWEVIGALARIDPGLVNDSAQVDLIVAWERQAAYVAAMSQPALVAVAFTETNDGWDAPHEPEGSGRAEVGAALRLSPHVAEQRLLVATDLCGRLACVQVVLSAGEISYWHATAIVEATLHLSDEKALWVAEKVLPRAKVQSVADLKRALRRAVLKADPKSAKERAAQAKAERRLDWWKLDDGMAEMRVVTSAADILAMVNAVDAMARQDFGSVADGSRIPVAARRADALVHLVTATNGAAADGVRSNAVKPKVTVHLTMDLATVLGFADNPADLAGYGPIDPATARALVADGHWRRLVFEPLTGALLDLGHSVYKPNAALTRYIEARDVRCQFPHCNQPAHRSHLDHTRKYNPDDPAGGRTDRNNLGALCEHHHLLKHRSGWTLRRDPDTEEATWRSPSGHIYRVEHEDYRIFDDYSADLADSDQPDLMAAQALLAA